MKRLPALVLLGVCATLPAAHERPLTVVGWGGASQNALREAYWKPFASQTGIRLQEDSWHGGVGVLRTRIRGGHAGWDVVQVEVEELILGCEEGLFEPLDWQALGGREQFIDSAIDECGVGSMVGSFLLGYDGDRLREEPRSWADFWDVKRFPGKRGMRKTAKYTLEIALMADGVAPRDVYRLLATEPGVKRAFAKLEQLRPHIIWWSSTSQVADLLASGEVIMSVATPGRLFVANRTEHRNFRFLWNGNLVATDFWVILKGSPNKADAMKLIAFMSQPAHQSRLPDFIPAGVTHRAAVAMVDPHILPSTPSHPRNHAQALAIDADFWVENTDQLNQRFQVWAAR